MQRHRYGLRWFAALVAVNFWVIVGGCFGTKMGPSTLKLDSFNHVTITTSSYSSVRRTENSRMLFFAQEDGFPSQNSAAAAENHSSTISFFNGFVKHLDLI